MPLSDTNMAIRRPSARRPLGHGQVDGKRPQIAVVDADDCAPAASARLELLLVVHLHQRVEPSCRAKSSNRAKQCWSSAATISSIASAPAARASRDLILVDDEVLAQDRHRDRFRAWATARSRSQISERPLEKRLVGQYRHRNRTAIGIFGRDVRRVHLDRKTTSGGRGPLELGDHRRSRRRERVRISDRASVCQSASLELRKRHSALRSARSAAVRARMRSRIVPVSIGVVTRLLPLTGWLLKATNRTDSPGRAGSIESCAIAMADQPNRRHAAGGDQCRRRIEDDGLAIRTVLAVEHSLWLSRHSRPRRRPADRAKFRMHSP